MPMKLGAGGKMQNYDSHGRYAKTNAIIIPPIHLSKKDKAKLKEAVRREVLKNRAKNSKDKYVFDVFNAIENEFPGEVQFVNTKLYDNALNDKRELDIITKTCIIEIKGEKGRKRLNQLVAQKEFAKTKGKTHFVFAPNILEATKREYEKNSITIFRNIDSLINAIKETKK